MSSFFNKFYLKSEINPNIVSIYSSNLIRFIAFSMMALFLPIYLYEVFGSVQTVILFYIFYWVIPIFIVPLGAMMMSKFGIKQLMMGSFIFIVGFFLLLFYFDITRYFYLLVLAVIASSIYKMMFWVPYHTDFVKFSDGKNRGRLLALLSAIAYFFQIFIPIVAGVIIFYFGFSYLFILMAIIGGVAVVPLFVLKPTYEKFSFGYFESFWKLFSKKNRKMFFAYAADGAQGIIGLTIWPIFIFLLLEEKYIAVGLISAVIILATIIVQLIMGKITDKFDKKKLMKVGTVLYALGWFSKVFVETGFHIFLASTYHNFAAIVMRTPFDTLMYEKAADGGHYVDEYTVLRDISLNIGRVFILVLAFFALYYISLNWVFVLAAVASLFINLLE